MPYGWLLTICNRVTDIRLASAEQTRPQFGEQLHGMTDLGLLPLGLLRDLPLDGEWPAVRRRLEEKRAAGVRPA